MNLQARKATMKGRSNETMRVSLILPFSDALISLNRHREEKNKKLIKKQLWRQKSRFTTA